MILIFGTLLLGFAQACGVATPSAAVTTAAPAPATAAALSPTTVPTASAAGVTPSSQLDHVTIVEAPVPFLFDLPLDVARGLDLFKQEGLDVKVTNLGGVQSTEALASGDADFVIGDPAVAQQAQGADFVMVVELERWPGPTLLVRSALKGQVNTVADLKGQIVTMPGLPGTVDSKLTQYLLARAGIKPEDMRIIPGGSLSTVLGGLNQGNAAAVMLDEPYTSQLAKQGKWYPLVDLRTESDVLKFLGGEYPGGLITTANMIQHRPQSVQKVVNAVVLALRYIATHTPDEIAAILPKDVIVIPSDKAAYVDGIQNSLPAFSKDGLMTEAGVKDWIEVDKVFGAIKPDQAIDVPALYTNDFVNQAR